ncbi:GNAT family N-acetyltransferase [Dethiothermospora halolimnae]|uniref:GNAT family N-acetyltransferase n=1 Tax=Dethiothermospora halolimnae TaxID=3114390 RepID=UPI003CCC2F44
MKRVENIDKDLKKRILELLYRDEIYNAILIELIEKYQDDLGELYIGEGNNEVTDILHIKSDGNSDFTSFCSNRENGLENIALQIKKLTYEKILLAGRLKDIKALLDKLGVKKDITPNNFYRLNIDKYRDLDLEYNSEVRVAKLNDEDIKKTKNFTIDFFEAETEEEIEEVSDTEKIIDKIKKGVYLLQYKDETIGMARFIGETNNFAEITSVYIDHKYRNQGFGKQLIGHMIDVSIRKGKVPVLVTSSTNFPAKKTYETMGFERYGDYAYEFIN